MPFLPVSIVIPVRNESGNIRPLLSELAASLASAGIEWEAIVVDDGSTDGSTLEIEAIAALEPRVRTIRFDQPRGKSAALEAGIAAAKHDRVVMLDGDGQDDPAEIPAMLSLLDAGFGLVNGWKHPRLDPWHKTVPSLVFNRMVGWFTGLRLHDHNCGLKAFRAEALRGMPLAEGMHRFLPVIVAAGGQGVTERAVHHRPRILGRTKYGPSRFVSGLIDLFRFCGGLPRIARDGGMAGHAVWRAVPVDAATLLRRSVYALLGAIACFAAAGRIGAVASVDRAVFEKRLADDLVARERAAGVEIDPVAALDRIRREKRLVRPFLSANDRSRWLTVRALVEKGTFAIDDLIGEPGWDTIDAVAHPDAGGRLRLYSSKPPLLSVIAAGPYWILHRVTGWTLGDHPFELGRGLLMLTCVVPLVVLLVATASLVDRVGHTDWGRIYAMALACFGTFLTTFATVFTNHLPAAACTAVSAACVWRIWVDEQRRAPLFLGAGVAAGLATAFELPCAAWFAVALAACAARDLGRTVTFFLPPAAIVAAAALGTNHLAHGTMLPAYAHRHGPDSWYRYEFTLPSGKVLKSYWENPVGVDRGEASPLWYAVHAIVGHHGILSLTPAWLLVIPGLRALGRRGGAAARAALAVAGISLAVIVFYLLRPQPDRNYGGVASGFRWVFWLAPLWVAAVVPAADRLSTNRVARGLAIVLLGLSVFSAAYPSWNPWTHPWIYQWMDAAGWLPR